MRMADLVCQSAKLLIGGSSTKDSTRYICSARLDDTKSLKGVVLDWITPQDQPLRLPLSRSIKTNHSFHHPTTRTLLCPACLDWTNQEFVSVLTYDILCQVAIAGPVQSLLQAKQSFEVINGHCWYTGSRSSTLKNPGKDFPEASFLFGFVHACSSLSYSLHDLQAFKHIFTSPSSVEQKVKATRSGNTHIHGMTHITPASLAYITMQVYPAFRCIKSMLNSILLASLCVIIILSLLQI